MLVIGRRVGKWTYIEHGGETLKVLVLDANEHGDNVRLGFEGPPTFRIWRDNAVQKEKEQGDA